MTDWVQMIDAAKAENATGVEMRRGKRYTSAAVRLEIARRYLGASIGVETEIVHYSTEKGAPIVVKVTIRSAEGRVLGQGTAEEIRGQGQVNSTSALENAETSALGRALAMMGLSGGEFASANELDGVERKKEAEKAQKPKPQDDRPLSQQAAATAPRQDKPAERTLSKAEGEAILEAIAGRATGEQLDAYMDALAKGPMAHAANHPKIKIAVEKRRQELREAGTPYKGDETPFDGPRDYTPADYMAQG